MPGPPALRVDLFPLTRFRRWRHTILLLLSLLQLALDTAATHPDRGYRFCHNGIHLREALSYAQLDVAARRIAVALHQLGIRPGERALLLYPAGLEFVSAFWGCVYAGVVAVPAPPPHPARLNRTLPRLSNIVSDCQPHVVLTHSQLGVGLGELPVLCTDQCPAESGRWSAPVGVETVMLQYTSGSSREPRGVRLSHSNLLHNLEMLRQFHGCQSSMVMVHWLPLYHDMGLIRGMLSPLHMGGDCVMLDPLQFVQRPLDWLCALSHFSATVTGAPDFGYALAARKIADSDLDPIDLSCLEVAFCSAEPIRKSSLDAFVQRFARCGLRTGALKPSYGLAEATVMVTAEMRPHYHSQAVSRQALAQSCLGPPQSEGDRLDLVCCGQPLGGQQLLIVDSHGRALAPDRVGEVWLAGGSVAGGYWNRPDDPTFAARLADGRGPTCAPEIWAGSVPMGN